MTRTHIQFAALVSLSLLAGALLVVICYTTKLAVAHITSDGKVPILDAGLFTAFLLAFQQVITTMRSIWESQERSALADSLSNSTPVSEVPKDAAEGARQAADAADNKAQTIEDKVA